MGFQQMVMRSIEEGIHQNDQRLELATFGMGCFWGPEARFGSMPGVVRTCVGFTGGTTPTPTYRQMGDHTETVHISFDPRSSAMKLSFENSGKIITQIAIIIKGDNIFL
nr:peptide-methionine (S)-S-oxide reductase [Planococcus faecalis]